MFGLEPWKPVLTALVLPPAPLILLVLVGARLILPRRGLGWLVVLLSTSLLWLSCCTAVGHWLTGFVLRPPPALSPDDLGPLKARAQDKPPHTAIVVLGGGRNERAPEYGVSDLAPLSAERLRYALWLKRQTGLPVAFSGGIGWADRNEGLSEAETAAYVAQQHYGQTLRWLETQSRDTRGNAALTVKMLADAGITDIVLVTHAWHMPRSLANFERAAAGQMKITPAPMGYDPTGGRDVLGWLPTSEGFSQVRAVLRELLGKAVGY